ncbi:MULTISPECIES: ATP-binding cassette domain-containing protein [Arthrobacter]|uniref:AAA family ATPase n=1 Tax=Arthrobacter TaxID=1663 RepID=UPI001BFDBCC3|nr:MULTISPECIES: AAA family ATPase [Arthrobacter]MBT8163038.1 ATP-binding cassette domain-containing protein [Arthrobacter sp. GN70]
MRQLISDGLEFMAPITFLVGENGSGKSTLIEAVAGALKLDSHGGQAGGKYAPARPNTELGEILRLDASVEGMREFMGRRQARRGFFLRAETAFSMMNSFSRVPGYWSADTATMSHGEGFMAVFNEMFKRPGIYLMDEPESALSFVSTLELASLLQTLADTGAQVICATHSPILTAIPGSEVLEIDEHGFRSMPWEDLSLVGKRRRYLDNPARFLGVRAGDQDRRQA